jgi:hypothetical protein
MVLATPLALLLILQQTPVPPIAGEALAHRNGRVPPAVIAVLAPTPPKLDGVLDEPAWATASPASEFRRDVPSDGKPAAERTDVRVLYDKDALYIGARLYNAKPKGVSRRLSRRDSFEVFNDVFFIIIDSYHDHSTSYVFGVTPAGERRDATITQDGAGLDPSWDPVWEGKTKVDSLGWVAEMRIPFSQLRFPETPQQVWGIQFRRDIRAAGEAVDWAWSPRTEPGMISKFGHLLGLQNIPPPRRLEVLPYTLGKTTRTQGADPNNPFDDGSVLGASAGLDLKYGLSSNLTLDATVNPDFGQVEADPAVVNLSAFETFFEERRPFFIEGAGIFGFGPGGSTQFFYSRRVGRPPTLSAEGTAAYVDQPTATSILGAGKLSGRTKAGWSVALLEAITGKEYAQLANGSGQLLPDQAVEPLGNYAVGRVRRESREGSSAVGAIFTAVNRRLDDPAFDPIRSAAYTGGVDFLHRFHQNAFQLKGYLGGTHVRGSPTAMVQTQRASSRYYQRPDQSYAQLDSSATSLSGAIGGLTFDKAEGNWIYTLATAFTSPGVELNDAGFQTDADRASFKAVGGRRWLQPGPVFRSLDARLEFSQRLNFGGVSVGQSLSTHVSGGFNNLWGMSVDLGYGLRTLDDKATRGGPLMSRPAGYHVGGGFRTDGRKAVSGGLDGFVTGDDQGTKGGGLSGSLAYRPQGSTDLTVTASYMQFHNAEFYVTQASDPTAAATYGGRYVFGALDQDNLNITLRLNVVVTPNVSIQWYAQPFLATGDYADFSWFATPRSYDFVRYGTNGSTIAYDEAGNRYAADADGAGPAKAVTFANPDFRVRSFRSNLVLRWEYHPGSTLYVVWNQNRGSQISDPAYNGFRDMWGIWDDPYQNILLVKLNYYLNF